jgi:hypothetical protein
MANPAAEARAKVQANYPGATVVERTHRGIRHNIGPNKYALDMSIGPMHYGVDQEIDTAWEAAAAPWTWQMVKAGFSCFAKDRLDAATVARYTDPNTGEYVELDPQNLQYSNDRNDIELIAVPDSVLGTISDDTVTWPDGYGLGRSFKWQAQTERLHKELILESGSLPAVPQFIRDGGNPVLELALSFRKSSSAVGIYVNGVLWDEKAGNPQETITNVEWRIISTQQTLWYFGLPRSWDSSVGFIIGTFTLKKQGPSLYITHRVPLLWIEDTDRVWPIKIDVTVDEQIGATGDDGYFRSDGPHDTSGGIGQISGLLGGFTRDAYRRYTGLSGLSGVTITTAYESLYGEAAQAGTPETNIYCEETASPSWPYSDRADYIGRSLTTAFTVMDTTITEDAWTNTPSHVSVLQELVNSVDPSEIVFQHRQDSAPADSRLTFECWDSDTTHAGKLHMEYTPSPTHFRKLFGYL